MKLIRESISYHFMVSTPQTAFLCEYLLQRHVLHSAECCGSALVSPWMANGDVLEHAKKYDELFNYKKFVRICSFAQFRRNIDSVVIDPRHCSRDQGTPLYGSSRYPWQLESSAYTLYLTLIQSTDVVARKRCLLETTVNR